MSLLIATIVSIVTWLWPARPVFVPLTGTLNIVVAPFSISDDSLDRNNAQSVMDGLVRGFSTALLHELKTTSGYDIDVAYRDNIGVTEESALEEFEEGAQLVSANIVIVGSAFSAEGRTVVQPAIYIRSGALPHAIELAGLSALGSTIDAVGLLTGGDPRLSQFIRTSLNARAAATAHLIRAVLLVSDDRHTAADSELAAASAVKGSVQGPLLQLFKGTILLKSSRLDAAAGAYKAIPPSSPTYGRAQVGLSEVELQRALLAGECGRGSGEHRAVALDHLEQAAAAPVPTGSYLKQKVVIARTRLALCEADISTALRADLDRTIIDLAQDSNAIAILADARMARGQALAQLPDRTSLEASARDLTAVLDLLGPLGPVEVRGLARWQLGLVRQRLGDRVAAERELQSALDLFRDHQEGVDPAVSGRIQTTVDSVEGDLARLRSGSP